MAIKGGIKDYIKKNVKDINILNDIDGYCNEFFKNQFEDCERIFDSFSEEKQIEYLMAADTIRYDFQILDDLEFLFEFFCGQFLSARLMDCFWPENAFNSY